MNVLRPIYSSCFRWRTSIRYAGPVHRAGGQGALRQQSYWDWGEASCHSRYYLMSSEPQYHPICSTPNTTLCLPAPIQPYVTLRFTIPPFSKPQNLKTSYKRIQLETAVGPVAHKHRYSPLSLENEKAWESHVHVKCQHLFLKIAKRISLLLGSHIMMWAMFLQDVKVYNTLLEFPELLSKLRQ